ncbi:hypothetical protein [Streptomyces sp. 840.1]|uniref:hypothetical protein n=1 Tax=Streptomyces sp. 840.1 TaxID=2485152 RepID=UPI0011CD90F0|nr:hypothetical protein [Streptomyces sp. 840.1]
MDDDAESSAGRDAESGLERVSATAAAHGRQVRVRRAVPDDVSALVRMCALMLSGMGTDTGDDHALWRAASASGFTDRMALSDEFAAFLVDDPELWAWWRAPSARAPRTRRVRGGRPGRRPEPSPAASAV